MATNSDGSIVLSVKIDDSNIKPQLSKLKSEIEDMAKRTDKVTTAFSKVNAQLVKAELQNEKLKQAQEKTAQAVEKTYQAIEKTNQAKLKTSQLDDKTILSAEKVAQAELKTAQQQEKLNAEKAKTAQQSAKQAQEEAKVYAEMFKANSAREKANQEAERTFQATERTKQAEEETRQAFEKTFQAQKKSTQEQEKTKQSIEKTRQSQEKTKQAVEKTTQAQNKTTEAINKSKKATDTWKSATKNITVALGKMATALGIVFGIRELLRFSNEASKLASQTESYILRIGQIYGQSSKQVSDFIDANAQALGMSKTAAYEAAASYGNLFSSFADGAENAKLTNQMLQTTAVIASKTGRSFDEVFTKIQSGIFGNTRAIDDLGVYVNQTTLKYTEAFQKVAQGRKWKDLTGEQQKEVLSLAILEQAYKKYGDTVLQSTALTRSQFNAAFQDFKATWGAVVNIVLMPVLRVLTMVFNYATMALKAVLKFFGKEVTVTSGAMNDVGAGSSNIADNIDNATKSQKKLNKEVKKSVAGFDDLQILSDNTGGTKTENGSGKGGGVSEDNAGVPVPTGDVGVADAVSNFDISPFENLKKILEEISQIFMSGFWNGFQNADFTSIDTAIKGIGDNLKKIFTSPEIRNSAQNFTNSFTYSLGQMAGSVGSIAITTGTNFYGGLNQYLTENLPFIQQSIAKIFDAGAYISETVGNLWAAFANIFSVFASQNGITLTSNIVGIFANAALGITTLATQIGVDFMNYLTQPIIDNQEGLKGVLDGLLGNFSSLTGSIKELVDGLVEDVLLLYAEHVQPFIETLTETVSTWVGNFVDAYNEHIKPVIDEFAQQFESLVQDHLKPMFDQIAYFIGNMIDNISNVWDTVLKPLGSWIIDVFAMTFSRAFKQLKDAVFTAVGFISDIIGSVFQILGGLIDFVTGAFSGDWDKAWNGLVNVFKGIVNGLISAFETAINAIVLALNGLIGGLNNIVNTAGNVIGQNWNIPSIPEAHLPRLARGAVLPANQPFLAVVGDQKRGTNIEAPAELIKQMAKEAIQEMGVTQNANQVIKEEHYYLNQTELMNIIYKLAKGGERIKGSNLVQQGGI